MKTINPRTAMYIYTSSNIDRQPLESSIIFNPLVAWDSRLLAAIAA